MVVVVGEGVRGCVRVVCDRRGRDPGNGAIKKRATDSGGNASPLLYFLPGL